MKNKAIGAVTSAITVVTVPPDTDKIAFLPQSLMYILLSLATASPKGTWNTYAISQMDASVIIKQNPLLNLVRTLCLWYTDECTSDMSWCWNHYTRLLLGRKNKFKGLNWVWKMRAETNYDLINLLWNPILCMFHLSRNSINPDIYIQLASCWSF